MARRRRLQVATLLSLVAMSGVVACDDADPADGPPTDSATDSSGDLTTPGTTLDVGETATVTRDGAGEVLEVTITGIDRGSSSDLADLERPSRGEIPFYVHYELKHVSGDSPYLPIYHFLSAWAGDKQLTGLTILVPFPACEEKTFSADAAVGTTVGGCATYVTENGDSPVDRIQFSYGDDYESFDGHQISWEQ